MFADIWVDICLKPDIEITFSLWEFVHWERVPLKLHEQNRWTYSYKNIRSVTNIFTKNVKLFALKTFHNSEGSLSVAAYILNGSILVGANIRKFQGHPGPP